MFFVEIVNVDRIKNNKKFDKFNEFVDNLNFNEKKKLTSYENEFFNNKILIKWKNIINKLYQLFFRIRNSITRLKTFKIFKYCDINKNIDIDLIEMFAKINCKHIYKLFKQMFNIFLIDYNNHYLISFYFKLIFFKKKQFDQ